MERWLTTTAAGLITLGVITVFLAAIIGKAFSKLWRGVLRQRVLKRTLHFLEANIRPFIMSRVLTSQYIRKQDQFRYIAYVHWTFIAFGVSSVIITVLIALIGVHFIVNGLRFSWLLFALFILTGLGLFGWLRDAFYAFGIIDQTFSKHLQSYKEVFPKLHPDFTKRLMTEDVETVMLETAKSLKAAKAKASADANSGSAKE